MSRHVSRAARLLDERIGLEMVAATGTQHAYLDAPRTTSKVGVRPYEGGAVAVSDDVRDLREMACAAYEQTLADICKLCLPIPEQNAMVIAAIRRKEAMMAAIGGAS